MKIMGSGGVAALAAVFLALGPAMAPGVAAQALCHGVDDLPRGEGPVRSMRLGGFDPARAGTSQGEEDRGGIFYLTFAFTIWDVPGVTFLSSGGCNDGQGGLVECSIDCDGGGFAVLADGEDVLFEALGPIYSAEGALAPFFSSGDADGERFFGAYRLAPVEQGGRCVPDAGSDAGTLAAGDISGRVAEAERLLAGLGYHREVPDQLFDARTAAAVAAFQGDFGLPVTGEINAETALAMEAATVAYGGC
jgi:hypothetical protein